MAPRVTTTETGTSKMKWDGSPTTRFSWFENLQNVLDLESTQFRTLWERGYIIDTRGRVLTSSQSHSYHLQVDAVQTKTFDDPNLCGTFSHNTADKKLLAFDPEDIDSRYVVALEVLRAKDREMFTLITDSITNSRRRKDYEAASDGSGTKLLKLLADELKTSSVEHGQYAARQMAALVEAGISSPTIVAFDTFREAYQNWNAQLPEARRLADTVVADVYVAAAYNLGEMLHTRIELLLLQTGGHGDLELTVKCILEVLGKHELSAVGRAFKTDPKRSSKPNSAPRVWTDGKDEICSVCNGKVDGGRHLRMHCPNRTDSTAPKSKDAKPAAGAKSSAKMANGKLYPTLDSDPDEPPENESDCRLADLFSSEWSEPINESIVTNEGLTQTGSAFVARTPAQMANASVKASPASTRVANPPKSTAADAVRRLSELTALSPMKEIRDVEAELQTGASFRLGGSDRRTRREILGDMRAAVGLPPLPVPFGLPIDTHTPVPTSTPITPASVARGQVGTPTATGTVENPLSITHTLGCPQLTHFCIECDSDGGFIHCYSFAYSNDVNNPFTLRHGAPHPPSRSSAPSKSRLLGRSADGLTLYWGTPDGALIACPANPNPTETKLKRNEPPSMQTVAAPMSPSADASLAPTGRPGTRTSPVRDATLALVSVIGTLAAMVLANAASGPAGHLPDPGEPHRRIAPRNQDTSLPLIMCLCPMLYLVLTKCIHVCQANRGGGKRRTGATPMPTYPSKLRWASIYYLDRLHAWRDVTDAMTDGSAPWRVAFLLLEWGVLGWLCIAGLALRLRISIRGTRRLMLHRRRHRATTASDDLHWLASLARFILASCVSRLASLRAGSRPHGHTAADENCIPTERCQNATCNRSGGAVFCEYDIPGRACADSCSVPCPAQIPRDPSREAPSDGSAERFRAVEAIDTAEACIHRNTSAVFHGDVLVGRALAATGRTSPRTQRAATRSHWRSSTRVRRWIRCVIDSGSTWHIHNNPSELVNARPCLDIVEDAAGNPTRCSHIGDLPLLVRDDRGREVSIVLRSVRCSADFSDTLISVDQLWSLARVDCIFRDSHHLCFTLNQNAEGEPLKVPFRRTDGLFRLHAGTLQACTDRSSDSTARYGVALKLRQGIHAPTSTAHLSGLPADQLAALLHRRLHIGNQHIRRLGRMTSDVPEHIASASDVGCPHCAEANAARLPHLGDVYKPSHAGRLIHADLAGPFKPSYGGGYRYCIILIDDHTRFKWIYFLHKKSDVNNRLRKFLSSFRALANQSSPVAIQPVGSLHTDRAGELTSLEFSELLDFEGVHQTTSPPHVHQLNGVAERAIRSTFSLVRSFLVASQLSPAFWTFAAEMAIDVLNRTTGPTMLADEPSSYELLTGSPSKALNLMPFGCRAFAVKPREQYSKTTIDPRAWVGTNLGRDPSSPSCFRIYVPSTGRIVSTSDVYFMEHLFPHRPKGAQTDDMTAAVPTRVPMSDEAPPKPAIETSSTPGFAQLAVSGTTVVATPKSSKSVLILFSGPYNRPDGIAALLRRRGVDVVTVDNCPRSGDSRHDLLNDSYFAELHQRARSGEFSAIFAAPPCSTYSVARYFQPKGAKSGAPPVRSRAHILGLPDLPAGHHREVSAANEMTRRTALILQAGRQSGAEFAIENPADRGDPSSTLLFHFPEHGPIWLDPNMIQLQRSCALHSSTFAQCMLGGPSQKYTTLWYTAGMPGLHRFDGLICSHSPGTHASPAGGVFQEESGDEPGTWNSASAAAYPAEMNVLIADAIYDSIITSSMLSGSRDGDRIAPSPIIEQPPLHSRTEKLDDVAHIRPGDSTEPGMVGDAPAIPAITPEPRPPLAASPEDTAPPDEPSPAPKRAYRRRDPSEFARGLGEIQTRSRRSSLLARRSKGDPGNHWEAMDLDAAGWSAAEEKEITNHATNHSWSYIPRSELPKGRRIVKLTWAYKTKRSGDLKARLCVQGCTQVPGVDYDQTFCAAMRAGSLRILCAIAARLGLSMRRWDFVAAYLQGELEPGEVVFCSPPPGYATKATGGAVSLVPRELGDGVDRLCRVERPVYGMAQAGRRWQRTIFPWLLSWNHDGASLKQSEHDSCIFHCRHKVRTPSGERDEWLLLGCYVDDLFILSSHTDPHSLYARFTSALEAKWDVEDEGEVSDLLSIEISAENEHVSLKQTRYIEKLMETYAPEGSPIGSHATYRLRSHQPSRTPCDSELPQLVADALTQSADDVDPQLLKQYQSIVGALLYCAVNTRPDVAYSVGMLCRAMGKPTASLLDAAYRVLFYLHHHKSIGLRYAACATDLSGMSDADWSAHYSTSGFVFQLSHAAISWGSKKQQSVALSSCEAEIMALSEAAKEGAYLTRFLAELGFGSEDPLPIHCDNTAARDLAYNPEHHERTKHIERRHFFVRDLVEEGTLTVPFVATAANMADFFTKPLKAADFYRHRNTIMNVPSRA